MNVDVWSILKIVNSGCCKVESLGHDVDGSISSLPIYSSPIECQPSLLKKEYNWQVGLEAVDHRSQVDFKESHGQAHVAMIAELASNVVENDNPMIELPESKGTETLDKSVLSNDPMPEETLESKDALERKDSTAEALERKDVIIRSIELERPQSVQTTSPLAKSKAKSKAKKISKAPQVVQPTKEELRAKKIKEIGKRFSQVFEDAKGGAGAEFPERVILLPPQSMSFTSSVQQTSVGRSQKMKVKSIHSVLRTPMQGPWPSGFQKVVIAGGCFWGLEMAMWRLPGHGIHSTAVGYAAGSTPNPTYEEVGSGRTGAAESVQVIYDPTKISIVDILRWFWECHDPTQGNGQGNDIGTQYRSGLYYYTEEQHTLMVASKSAYQKALDRAGRGRGSITTEIVGVQQFKQSPGALFYYAEDSHQQYFAKPGRSPYCSAQPLKVTLPPFEEWAPTPTLLSKHKAFLSEAFWEQHGPQQTSHQTDASPNIIRQFEVAKPDTDWRQQLGTERYEILRSKATERPGSGEYDRYFPKKGVFRCAACELPIYSADSKFKSDCGWPCFDQVIHSKERGCHVLVELEQGALELICCRCGSHLGHVFFGEKCTARDERH